MRLIPCIALILAGCAHDQSVAVRTVELKVPVPVNCVDESQIPAEPEKVGDKLTGNPVIDSMILAESALTLRKWGEEQAALLRGCV